MSDLYFQFFTVATIHLFAVMSPGPDFAIILKQSLSHGRKLSIITSLGIGTGILVHVLFCMFGLGMVISESKFLFNFIKILGAIYLFYIGTKSLIQNVQFKTYVNNPTNQLSALKSFRLGFLTNVLNPKATLFFLSLYATIITDQTTISVQAMYGLWMSAVTGFWFCLLSIMLTNTSVIQKIQKFTVIIQRGTGVVLIVFAIKLLFSNQ